MIICAHPLNALTGDTNSQKYSGFTNVKKETNCAIACHTFTSSIGMDKMNTTSLERKLLALFHKTKLNYARSDSKTTIRRIIFQLIWLITKINFGMEFYFSYAGDTCVYFIMLITLATSRFDKMTTFCD
jgi:hypothetical protein